jgi:uncharacterized membrane protein
MQSIMQGHGSRDGRAGRTDIAVSIAASQQWLLRSNCSLSPGQLAACFFALGLVSLVIAGVFALQGAWPVIVFSCVEVLALAIAFFVYGRHAGDYERIEMDASRVVVESVSANRLERRELLPQRLRVEYEDRKLIQLVQGGQSLSIGRFVASDQRKQLADELRLSLAAVNRMTN